MIWLQLCEVVSMSGFWKKLRKDCGFRFPLATAWKILKQTSLLKISRKAKPRLELRRKPFNLMWPCRSILCFPSTFCAFPMSNVQAFSVPQRRKLCIILSWKHLLPPALPQPVFQSWQPILPSFTIFHRPHYALIVHNHGGRDTLTHTYAKHYSLLFHKTTERIIIFPPSASALVGWPPPSEGGKTRFAESWERHRFLWTTTARTSMLCNWTNVHFRAGNCWGNNCCDECISCPAAALRTRKDPKFLDKN